MTLFNGLLCFSGDLRGCNAVREAQDPKSGEWHRSPRIRALGKNDQGDANSSPDMAIGVQLYLISTRDHERALKWLNWINNSTPCTFEIFRRCVFRGLPRFCTEQPGCTIRPGDAALLSSTVEFLQKNAGLSALADGPLRGMLGTFSGYGRFFSELDARVNKDGFSRHLVAAAVVAFRAAGADWSRFKDAAQILVSKNSENAFFEWLANGRSKRSFMLTKRYCPTTDRLSTPPLNEWQWERAISDRAWEHSMYWDCIFMANLLAK